MGLFSRKKDDMYERNARIAELESKIDAMSKKMERLKGENAELRAQLSSMKNANEALSNEKDALGHNLKALRRENGKLTEELDDSSDDDPDRAAARQRIRKDEIKAEELKRLAMEQYAMELKRLKLFSDKWQAFYDDSTVMKKQELANLLTDLLRNSDQAEFILESKAKTDEAFRIIEESKPFEPEKIIKDYFDAEENGFNLDDAVNPKGELDLEDLCKELGVFEG